MAIIIFKGANATVDNIAERDAINRRVDGMFVAVEDAIADVNAGPGWALYQWKKKRNRWWLITKEAMERFAFYEEEKTISNNEVIPDFFPNNGILTQTYITLPTGEIVDYKVSYSDGKIHVENMTDPDYDVNGCKLHYIYFAGNTSYQVLEYTYGRDYLDLHFNQVTQTANTAAGTANQAIQMVGAATSAAETASTKADDAAAKAQQVQQSLGSLGTAAGKNVPASGNADLTQVVMGDDSRLTDSRTPTAHGHTATEITGLDEALTDFVHTNDTRLTDARPASDVHIWAKAENKPSYTPAEVGALASSVVNQPNGVLGLDAKGRTVAQGGTVYRTQPLGVCNGTVILDISAYDTFVGTITGNTVFDVRNPPTNGQGQTVALRLTNPGAFTLTWPTGTKRPGGAIKYTVTGTDVLTLTYDANDGGYTVAMSQKDVK